MVARVCHPKIFLFLAYFEKFTKKYKYFSNTIANKIFFVSKILYFNFKNTFVSQMVCK